MPTAESPRPEPEQVLGGKGASCFGWSAAYDDDEEFLRRYGEPARARWMLAYHANDLRLTAACRRLRKLTKA